jgi:hypothetical protein
MRRHLLLVVLALAWYNVGTIWAHEVDIFRSWRLIPSAAFPAVQAAHWRKLPYWVFVPVGLTLVGSVVLVWVHPSAAPQWAATVNAVCQLLSLVLTAGLWGRWQAALSRDARGAEGPWLRLILRTHWIRTGLITIGALVLLVGEWAAL